MSNCPEDTTFGPSVSECRGGFDFTLLFEQSILSVIPSCLVLLIGGWRIWVLYRQSRKTVSRWSGVLLVKLIVILCLAGIQLALNILWVFSLSSTKISIAASALSFTASLVTLCLSYLEHNRSVRPSTILNVYFLFSLILDLPQTRTLWIQQHNAPITVLFTTSQALKILALILETIEKRTILQHPYSTYPPDALAGILNRSLFIWLNPLLLRGYSSILDLSSLFDLNPHLTSAHIQPRFRKGWQTANKQNKHALIYTTIRCLYPQILSTILPRLLVIVFKMCQPLLIQRAVSLLQDQTTQDKTTTGRALIAATALTYLGLALMNAKYLHNTYKLACAVRGGLVGLIYDATLELGYTATGQSAAITLMDTDIERIVYGVELVDRLWAGPIEIGVALWLLSRQIGGFCGTAAGLSVVFICCPLALAPLSSTALRAWIQAVQERVAATASALGQMRAIKIMGVADTLQKRLHDLRVTELKVSAAFRGIFSVSITLNGMLRSVIPAASLIIYVLVSRDSSFDPTVAFTSLSLIALVTDPTKLVSRAITPVAGSVGCFQRIQEYLTADERVPVEVDGGSCGKCGMVDEKVVSVGVTPVDGDALVRLKDVDFTFDQKRENHAVRGITLDIYPGSFTVVVGSIGSGKSALLLALLNELHLTKGCFHASSLRIGYCAQTPWLPHLSIRDIITGSSDFDSSWYNTVLHACALIEDIKNMPEGDNTLVGGQGARLSGGQRQRISLARAVYSRHSLLLLDDVLSGLDASTEQMVMRSVFGDGGLCRRHGMAVVLVTHAVRYVSLADRVVVMQDMRILQQGPPSKMDLQTIKSTEVPKEELQTPSTSAQEPTDEPATWRKTGDVKLYWYYIRSIGLPLTLLFIFIDILSAFSIKFPSVLVEWWSDAEMHSPGLHTTLYVAIYILFCLINLTTFAGMSYILLQIATPRSSINLHSTLLTTVLSAPLSLFIATESGTLLNRFSQDMSLIDMDLPISMMDFLFSLSGCLAETGLILSASKYAALIFPPLLLILYLIQKFYLRSSRQMRLLDIEAKSPLYTHFLATLTGLPTIRAFHWQDPQTSTNNACLDLSQRPLYLLYSIQCWLGLVLDITVAGLATFIMALATQIPGSDAGGLGVSLVNVLSFSGNLCFLVQFWTDLETSLGAVARVKRFEEETVGEDLPGETVVPEISWPGRGEIQFVNMSAKYRDTSEAVLKDICLDIQPGQKVAICGRTGSGKSTLLLSLLHLVSITGDILIDNIPISTIPRSILRQRITAMPQDPLLLSGSVRSNIDLSSTHPDTSLITALEKVNIWSLISARGGLDTDIDSLALSRGQQQLFCLARILLSTSRIVVFDEVTANVDAETGRFMMDVIARELAGRTVVVIAHDLELVRGFERVIVLGSGRVLEDGVPGELLNGRSVFRGLWERRGD